MTRFQQLFARQLHHLRSLPYLKAKFKNRSLILFLKELLTNPRHIGAACPSSRRLAEGMASFVPLDHPGYVIELGAGTGVVTAALLRRGIKREKLIVIERSAHFTTLLRKRFPDVTIINGDAARLDQILLSLFQSEPSSIAAIVSSLPFKALPREISFSIRQKIENLISTNGSYIQYTYDIRPRKISPFTLLRNGRSKIIWLNLPPARITQYKKQE